jgi:anti-sigma factor RsiW
MSLNCRQMAEDLLRFRDGQLPPAEVQHLREHLHLCPPCASLFRTYDEAVEVLARLRPVRMPDGLLDRLKARLDSGGPYVDPAD